MAKKNTTSTGEVVLLFPHQLYAQHPLLAGGKKIVLLEEYLYFSQYTYHAHKLVLHRASMQAWAGQKSAEGLVVEIVEAAHHQPLHDVRHWLRHAAAQGLQVVHAIDPTDDWLLRRLQQSCLRLGITLHLHDSPNFLNAPSVGDAFFAGKKHYHQTDFYIAQRKERNLLLEPGHKPLGGKWTFDAENRARFPKGAKAPALTWPSPTPAVQEAIRYVQQHFPNAYGHPAHFAYPVTRQQALDWLQVFLQQRFAQFGVYEDAMVASEGVLYHSVLTPMLNIGLLSPQEIIDAALHHATAHAIPLNSLEGFVRQIVGWREFIRIVYHREGRRQRTTNYWGFTRKIPKAFWAGTTGIDPIDKVIQKTLDTGYNHHIERLMVLGNFFVLCEFDPNEVYRWFMEMYIDAYDWVMVPNVYGMTQFADGGLMTTKPYISGSNYLMKMGDWPKGSWQAVWDGLFWRFMHVHRSFFQQNPRLGMLVNTFDKMSADKRAGHLARAAAFLQQLDEAGGV